MIAGLRTATPTLLLGWYVASACAKVYFSETFGDDWESRWVLSKWKESGKEKMGQWTTAAGKWFGDEAEDRGLQTAQTMKFYGIAAAFEPFSNEGKDLIVQYQAKYEKDLVCGGGYLKVGPTLPDLTTFGEPTSYNIMFGPDQCNADKRTHLIFTHKGKNYLKKQELPFKQEGEGVSHLYRLVLRQNNSVRVDVDQEKLYEGPLGEDWDMLPVKDMVDPEDKKPTDWVDQATMEDPSDKKPSDWVDEKRFRDPKSSRPEEWDEEEDGEWEAPMIDNPEYKGTWSAKQVDNPAYKGTWAARRIPNPDFVDNPQLYRYDEFGFVGFDVWQVKGGTIFDNIIITDDVGEADAFAEKWKALSEVEKRAKEQANKEGEDFFAKARAARAARDKAAEDAKKSANGKVRDGGAANGDSATPLEVDSTAVSEETPTSKTAAVSKGDNTAAKSSDEL